MALLGLKDGEKYPLTTLVATNLSLQRQANVAAKRLRMREFCLFVAVA